VRFNSLYSRAIKDTFGFSQIGMAPPHRAIYTSAHPRKFSSPSLSIGPASSIIRTFHASLPEFATTPLVSLPAIASELGLRAVYVKDETSRLGLPSFKILGAAWAICRAVAKVAGLDLRLDLQSQSDGAAENGTAPDVLRKLATAARECGLTFVTATDGNHGRAVARMARLLGVPAVIFIPYEVDAATRERVSAEGAEVIVVQGDYDVAVRAAVEEAARTGALLIQDTAFEGYEEVPEES
jgi:diaminopropionate ammonia-lyase